MKVIRIVYLLAIYILIAGALIMTRNSGDNIDLLFCFVCEEYYLFLNV